MFSPSPKIQFEHELCNKILLEGAQNDVIKQILQELANVLRAKILKPLQDIANAENEFSKINPEFQDAIVKLASQHTNEDRQYGGLLRTIKDSKQIVSNINTVKFFLQTLDDAVCNIPAITDKEKFAQAIKVMADLGFVYTVFLKTWHTQDFQTIHGLLWPSPEEFKARLSPKELGLPPYLSLTFGIGREPGEIIPATEDKGDGFHSGKVAFLLVDVERRLRLMAEQYDEIFLDTHEESRNKKLKGFFAESQKDFGSPLTEEFKNYSGDASHNFKFAEWARKIGPSSIKLIRSVDCPLVASISGSMARLLITLEDLHGFDDENGLFGLAKAQLLANIVMALFGKAGHHSSEEVIETYRRLLDYILLNPKRKPLSGQTPDQVPDRTPAEFKRQMELSVEAEDFNKRLDSIIQDGSAIEARVGYPVAGDYRSFLHEELKKILPETPKLTEKNYRISFL